MANKAIRGITVEIGGNTTKLDKALGESEKKSRSLQVELREITKLLKLDPTNVELLGQKQAALNEIIAETSKKLDTMKEAEAQVVAQFERGEIGENQLRAFQREIMQTETSLKDMRNELSTTEKAIKDVAKGHKAAEDATSEYEKAVENAKEELADFKDKASETFETLKNGASVIGTALGGAMVATGGYALKLSTDFDKAFNTLITKTGASSEEMDGLNEAMERVYANNFGESIEDVANSMATVKTQTGLVGEELQAATENALLMRDTFDFEVNESIRAVNSLMDQFGITSEEAYNLIAQGAQKGLNQNDDLLDTINEYSVQFKNAGYSAEDMFNMLANGVESGTWSVDKLGDAVKEFNIRMSDGSAKDAVEALGFSWEKVSEAWSKGGDEAKDVFNMLINELDGLENTTEGYNIGVGLMGTMFEDLGHDAVLALSNTQGEIDKTSKALEDINNTKYDDIGSAIQGLGRTLETDVIKPLGEELKPVVEEAIEYVKDNGPEIKDILSNIVESVGNFVGWIVDNSDILLATITGIGTGLLVWNVASIINGVVGAIKAYQLANEGATIAQTLFNAVLNANPLMLIVTLVLSVIAAIVAFVATNDEARAKIVEIWEKIKKAFSDAWEFVKKTWSAAKEFFANLWDNIKQTFASVGSWFSNLFSSAWTGVKNAWSSTTSFFSGIWSNVKNTFSSVGSWFRDTFSNAWSSIKSVFSGWGDFFGGLWTKIKNKFSDIGTSIANAISGSVKSGINGVISNIESVINSGIRMINGAISLINKIPGVSIGKFNTVSFPRLAKGGIVDRPTIAEVGENGREAIIPLENNTGWLRKVARELSDYIAPNGIAGNRELMNKLDRIYDRLDRLQVVLDSGETVGALIDKIDSSLNDRYDKFARGW